MKKSFVLLAILSVLLLCACAGREGEEPDSPEEERYDAYSGMWSVGGVSHLELLEEGGTEFEVEISGNDLKASIYSVQWKTQRIAEIENITAKIQDNECYYEFEEDGWSGSGTLHIKFLQDKIEIEVQDYKMSDSNSSGFGINGIYELVRAEQSQEPDNLQTSRQPEEGQTPQQPEMDPISPSSDENPVSQSEEDSWEKIYEKVYEKYYAPWDEDTMLEEINNRQVYREACSFYADVVHYMEFDREVTDTSMIIEPVFVTDLKYYSEEDFEDVPDLIIHLAKNEIYARHGYIFKDEDLANYFMGQLWYTPTCEAKDFDTQVFNDYERHNLDILAGLDNYGK